MARLRSALLVLAVVVNGLSSLVPADSRDVKSSKTSSNNKSNASKSSRENASKLHISKDTKVYASPTFNGMLAPAVNGTPSRPVLYNHGGDVMHNAVTVHYLWVGEWTDVQRSLFKTFTSSISSKDDGVNVPGWWAINTQYKGNSGKSVTASVANGKEASFPRSAFQSPEAVAALVGGAITSGKLPGDVNAVYAVLGDEETTQVGVPMPGLALAGYCQTFCGWHDYFTLNGVKYKLLFAANTAKQCPTACISSQLTSGRIKPPNGDIGIDGLISTYAHELAEATSDPYLDAWSEAYGYENADICQYKFGDVITTSDERGYNMVGVKGSQFLIQQNWDESSQKCLTFM